MKKIKIVQITEIEVSDEQLGRLLDDMQLAQDLSMGQAVDIGIPNRGTHIETAFHIGEKVSLITTGVDEHNTIAFDYSHGSEFKGLAAMCEDTEKE